MIGRFFDLQLLSAHSPATTRPLRLLLPAIYCLGFYGLRMSPPASSSSASSVPFLGELLYPGACGLMPVVVPLLRWPRRKHRGLLLAALSFSLAFLGAALEGALCSSLGPHWTSPALCFAMCDVLFCILANLVDVQIL